MLAILFEIDDRLWGADARLVETVVPAVRLREVEGAPKWISGVFNYRGAIVPAVDLSILFSGKPAERTFSTRYMLVKFSDGGREALAALVARRITTVAEIDDASITPPEGASYGGGVFSVNGRLAQVFKIENFIDSGDAGEIFRLYKIPSASIMLEKPQGGGKI